jgi:hypothetical protein
MMIIEISDRKYNYKSADSPSSASPNQPQRHSRQQDFQEGNVADLLLLDAKPKGT